MTLAKDLVTRWHPEFLMENVPEVPPADLPVAPGQEKVSSAKDVLAHARHLFSVNPRMGKALERVAANGETMVEVEVVDAQTSTPPASPAARVAPAVPTKPNITSALKGLPKALLEKVTANQENFTVSTLVPKKTKKKPLSSIFNHCVSSEGNAE